MSKNKDYVIFREWQGKFKGDIIAVFPYFKDTAPGCDCMCYEHIGQHGSGDYQAIISQTKPANASSKEVKDLIKELKEIGYNLIIIKIRNRKDIQE